MTEGVSTVSELGLAFLFLIAGYEVNPREFATSLGRTAVGTWFVSLAIGFALVALTLRETPSSLHAIARNYSAHHRLRRLSHPRGVAL